MHTFLGVLYAAVRRPDVVHIHAVGPWLFVPLAKLLGLKVVVTHHGQDYLREKWHGPARALLRLGEHLGMSFADERIVISHSIHDLASNKYHRNSTLIPNGVANLQPVTDPVPARSIWPQPASIRDSSEPAGTGEAPARSHHGLQGRGPARLEAAAGGRRAGFSALRHLVREHCGDDGNIINTGFLTPPEVQELLTHAGIFALPSSHEGLPISLLEAMRLGTPIVASDIPANRETGLDDECYFAVGDTDTLALRLRELAAVTTRATRGHGAAPARDVHALQLGRDSGIDHAGHETGGRPFRAAAAAGTEPQTRAAALIPGPPPPAPPRRRPGRYAAPLRISPSIRSTTASQCQYAFETA